MDLRYRCNPGWLFRDWVVLRFDLPGRCGLIAREDCQIEQIRAERRWVIDSSLSRNSFILLKKQGPIIPSPA